MPPFIGPASSIQWDEAEVRAILEGANGPVAREILRRCLLVEASAKNFATGVGGGPRVRTNRLRSSISTRIGQDAEGVYGDVGTIVYYGGYVELGTKNPDGSQRNKPYPYLRPALAAAQR